MRTEGPDWCIHCRRARALEPRIFQYLSYLFALLSVKGARPQVQGERDDLVVNRSPVVVSCVLVLSIVGSLVLSQHCHQTLDHNLNTSLQFPSTDAKIFKFNQIFGPKEIWNRNSTSFAPFGGSDLEFCLSHASCYSCYSQLQNQLRSQESRSRHWRKKR